MPKKKEIICLICCRGGSKTIKNKNIKLFNKKPLLYWSLKNLIKSKVFTKIVLSTDSDSPRQILPAGQVLVSIIWPTNQENKQQHVFYIDRCFVTKRHLR